MLLPDQFEPHGVLHCLYRQAPLLPPAYLTISPSHNKSNYQSPSLHWAGGAPGRGTPQAFHRVCGDVGWSVWEGCGASQMILESLEKSKEKKLQQPRRGSWCLLADLHQLMHHATRSLGVDTDLLQDHKQRRKSKAK